MQDVNNLFRIPRATSLPFLTHQSLAANLHENIILPTNNHISQTLISYYILAQIRE